MNFAAPLSPLLIDSMNCTYDAHTYKFHMEIHFLYGIEAILKKISPLEFHGKFYKWSFILFFKKGEGNGKKCMFNIFTAMGKIMTVD